MKYVLRNSNKIKIITTFSNNKKSTNMTRNKDPN